MKKLSLTQEGFIPMLVMLTLIIVAAIVFVFLRVARHQ